MNLAQSLLRNGDMGGAKEALDKVKAKNATQENLWSMYGFVAVMERDDDEAVADFRKEIASHPDNSNAVGALASAQAHAGDSLGARQTLSHYLDQHQNVQLSLYLASLQNSAHDYNAALKTLQSAADQNPDDRHILIQISDTLFCSSANRKPRPPQEPSSTVPTIPNC